MQEKITNPKEASDIIEIKPTGSYFEIDSEGYLVNPASKDKIQEKWRPVVDAIVEKQKENFGDKLISVYIRGSVSKGEAIEGISDVDSFSYINEKQADINKDLTRESQSDIGAKFPFAQKVEMAAYSDEYIEEDQFLISQSVLVYGTDLQKKRFKIGRELIRHLKNPDNTKKVKQLLEDGMESRDVCVWVCKQILRTAMETTLERSQKYSRDLYRCWEVFSEYCPEKSDEMKQVLFYALNPMEDEGEIIAIAEKWGAWFTKEKERLGY